MDHYKSTWVNSGKLSHLKTSFSGGVYLFVFEGSPYRIIYVGTAKQSTGFTTRWCQHIQLFKIGGRTVWRPGERDVYSLLSSPPELYETHCNDMTVWMPSGKIKNGYYKPYYSGVADYEQNWKSWVLSEYLDKISVWRCIIKNDTHANILESQIQIAFIEKFRIGYYTKLGNQSWLGRVEISDKKRRNSICFEFEDLPDVEVESKELLLDLVYKQS